MSSTELADQATQNADNAFKPGSIEEKWYNLWDSSNLFAPGEDKNGKFVILLPPPNVTGQLHLGHALTVAIQDGVVRFQRMNGKSTLWVPGLDHAGIATQVVVEKQLMKTENKSRHDLGREGFVQRVWEWKEEYGSQILTQLRSLGASLDWSRSRFTMDEMCREAVLEAFIQLYHKNVIYRENRLVSWSCALKSAISSIEVDHIEVDGPTMINVPNYDKQVEIGVFHHFAYRLESDPNVEIVVATTRLETMLGDVAVAVDPDDVRYKHLIGSKLVHPFIPERSVTVIGDIIADATKGTGAVKITPAHDPKDYECGKRNNLEFINILDDDGTMNSNAGKYNGLHRFAVRELLVDDLTACGLYRGKTPNPMSVGVCSRSNDIVEPLIKPQWWVSCSSMAQRALDAAHSGELTLLPGHAAKSWDNWLENIQDWCISRQLWWGHRIPAYYALSKDQTWPVVHEDMSRWIIARTEEDALKIAADKFPNEDGITFHQDDDVLDTWFSSGLFPFSVMGWPNKESDDFKQYFPGHLLETGSDILFFWVARMVMLSQELTGKLPFTTVYLHSLVRDRSGRKMSKSLGNVIDPLDVINGITLQSLKNKLRHGNLGQKEIIIAESNQEAEFPNGIEQCGTDALRFGLLSYTKQGADINLDISVIISARKFCNKMWQACRFALSNFDTTFIAPNGYTQVVDIMNTAGGMLFEQRWILSKLAKLIGLVTISYETYQFGETTLALQSFFVDDLCSFYLEIIKKRVKKTLQHTDSTTGVTTTIPNPSYNPIHAPSLLAVLYYCIEQFLLLLHPIMPFVTEELYQRLPGNIPNPDIDAYNKGFIRPSIMIQQFPLLTSDLLQLLQLPGHEQQQQPLTTIIEYNTLITPTERDMILIRNIIDEIRSAKARLEIHTSVPNIYLDCTNNDIATKLDNATDMISTLAFVIVTPRQSINMDTVNCLRFLITSDITLNILVDNNTSINVSLELFKNEIKKVENENKAQILKTTIEKTKDNPKVKDEIKLKQQNDYDTLLAEIALLDINIPVYRDIVDNNNDKKAIYDEYIHQHTLKTQLLDLNKQIDANNKQLKQIVNIPQKYNDEIKKFEDKGKAAFKGDEDAISKARQAIEAKYDLPKAKADKLALEESNNKLNEQINAIKAQIKK